MQRCVRAAIWQFCILLAPADDVGPEGSVGFVHLECLKLAYEAQKDWCAAGGVDCCSLAESSELKGWQSLIGAAYRALQAGAAFRPRKARLQKMDTISQTELAYDGKKWAPFRASNWHTK